MITLLNAATHPLEKLLQERMRNRIPSSLYTLSLPQGSENTSNKSFFHTEGNFLEPVTKTHNEETNSTTITYNVAGFTKDEINVELSEKQITIHAENDNNKLKTSFTVKDIKEENVNVEHVNGQLIITITNPEPVQHKTKKLEIK